MNYLLRHLQVLLQTLGEMSRHPVATAITVAVVGITLAVPACLYVALRNLEVLTRGLDTGSGVTVYLHSDATGEYLGRLAGEIGAMAMVDSVRITDAVTAFEELKSAGAYGDSLSLLPENPLPHAITVSLSPTADRVRVDEILAEIEGREFVDEVRIDLKWIDRLISITQVVRSTVWLLGLMLAAAVILVISNTVRLAILNRADEIEVVSRIGGSDAFIRRPFLYRGALQGAFGGLLAALIVTVCLVFLKGPLDALIAAYDGRFEVQGLGPGPFVLLTLGGGVLGWLASRVTVERHLIQLRPR